MTLIECNYIVTADFRGTAGLRG